MKKELSEELQSKFKEMKKELGFKATFKEMEKIFFLQDFVAKDGFVSEQLSRAICHRMSDLFNSWNGYMHNLVLPNPGSMINVEENKMLSDEDKQKMIELMNKNIELVSRNGLIGLSKNKKEESKYVDDCVSHWNKTLQPYLLTMMKKINGEWAKRSK